MILNSIYDIAYESVVEVRNEIDLSYPIDPFKIIEHYGIECVPYSKFNINGYNKDTKDDLAHLIYGTKTYRPFIIYNDKKDIDMLTFSLMHELGHYLCGHYENTVENDRVANCFARNIICPPDMVTSLDFLDITLDFNMSLSASIVRIEKLDLDKYHFKKIEQYAY